jgi:hypothetical protein
VSSRKCRVQGQNQRDLLADSQVITPEWRPWHPRPGPRLSYLLYYGPKNEYGHNHRAIILACGHTVGNSCAYLGDLKACPICRANLTHACCGHRHKGNSIPWEIKELDSIPQDLNWGGFIPGSCNSCVARQSLHMLMEWIAWSAPLSRLPAATTSNRE